LPQLRDIRLLAVIAALSSLITLLVAGGSPRASAATLPAATWSASKTTVLASGVAYTYTVMAASTSRLSKVTMTVPATTSAVLGGPSVGTVSPASIDGVPTVTLSGTTLTYTFTPATVTAGTVLSIQITGLVNTSFANTYTSTITSENGSTVVDTGTAPFTFTLTALSNPGWNASSTMVGAGNTSYTYTFTPSSALTAVSLQINISLPPGTGGSPSIGTVSPVGLLGGLNAPSLNASGTMLTITGTAVALSLGTPISIQINGLTNTYTAGTYVPEITTNLLGILTDSNVAPAITFPGALVFAAPAALAFSGTLSGKQQALADGAAAAEQLLVDDQTGSGAGWNVTVAATSFVDGSYSLPGMNVLEVTGSVTNPASQAVPTASCFGTSVCTLPDDSTLAYPIGITSAAQSPTPETVYEAKVGSGIGPIAIGSTTANPVGWWLNVPATAASGAYTSTVTVTVASGP
jgi:hypothetical protein